MTPKAAPLDTPSTEGSARGLRVRAWKATPATARAPPARIATAMRGSRRPRVTTRSTASGSARPASARTTAAGERAALPTNSETVAVTRSVPRSTDRATARRALGREGRETAVTGQAHEERLPD